MKLGQRLWAREELIITLDLYCKLPFGRLHNRNPEIIRLAGLIQRTSGSVAFKLGNLASLDPELAKRGIVGLVGASKLDKEIWKEFENDRERLALEAATTLAKLTNKKIEETVPEVLTDLADGVDIQRLVKTRVNQRFFRDSILGLYDYKCCVSGIDLPNLLVASHIVPWAIDISNRLNPTNGLCLSSLFDKAFDTGLMTVDTDYKIQFSKKILDLNETEQGKRFFNDFNRIPITLPDRHYPNKDFLDFHNRNIFIG